jgi:branched-chain amino acid transport system ATP-binding protein
MQALWDISLQVSEGEIVTLLGSNGAGKTTTLHAISGLLRLRTGTAAELLADDAIQTAYLGL